MADNKVSFDSNDVSSIVSSLNTSAQTLVSVSSSVTSSFSPLTSCDLFSDGISKLSQKLESIKTSFEGIITAIGGQTQTYSDVESAVQQAGDNYMSYYDGGSSGGISVGGKYSDDSVYETFEIYHGESVNTSLDDVVSQIDDKTLVSLLNFININKDENVTISDLLKEENSEILIKYLVEFFKKYTNVEYTYTDKTLIRKELIKCILNSTVDLPKSIKDNSIIMFKTYLESIAKSCKITVADLLIEPEYSELAQVSLSNLYLNKAEIDKYDITEQDLENFRQLVALRTKEYNMSVDELFKNPIYLV